MSMIQYMMISDDKWWQGMIYDDTWWKVMIYDDKWLHIMTHGDRWSWTYNHITFDSEQAQFHAIVVIVEIQLLHMSSVDEEYDL